MVACVRHTRATHAHNAFLPFTHTHTHTTHTQDCGKPSQSRYHVPNSWLRSDSNLVVLFDELGGQNSNPAQISIVPVNKC